MININTKNTKNAEHKHKDGLLKKITTKIDSSDIPKYLKKYLLDNLENILVGKPKELLDINDKFIKTIKGLNKAKFNSKLSKIFNYGAFADGDKREYNFYNLADNLNINCCPNCNRQYTITISKKNGSNNLTKPDFDHYFSKKDYPILAISFYNLIPSCTICNSIFKGSIEMNLNDYLHPYIDNSIHSFSFDYEVSPEDPLKCGKIFIHYLDDSLKDKITNTFDLFKIEEVYNGHKFIVDQLIKLKKEVNGDYLKILTEKTYDGINWTPEEAYKLAFGVSHLDDELNDHPFSKLKRDILTKEEMLSIFYK